MSDIPEALTKFLDSLSEEARREARFLMRALGIPACRLAQIYKERGKSQAILFLVWKAKKSNIGAGRHWRERLDRGYL
jgi:hypothetical protein